MRFAQVPERVSTTSFVVLIIGNSKSNDLGAQGTFKEVSSFESCVCMCMRGQKLGEGSCSF